MTRGAFCDMMNIFKRREVVKPVKIIFYQKDGIVSKYEFPKKGKDYTYMHITFPQGREACEATIYFDWPEYEC